MKKLTGSGRKLKSPSNKYRVEYCEAGTWRTLEFDTEFEAERDYRKRMHSAVLFGYVAESGCYIVPEMPRLIAPAKERPLPYRADIGQ